MKKWKDEDDVAHALVFTPMETQEFVSKSGKWVAGDFQDKHNFGVVPVFPLVNRPRILRPDGRSEFVDIIPLADAANKMATDMMVSGEFHAMPRRWAFGLKQSDFVDRHGNRCRRGRRSSRVCGRTRTRTSRSDSSTRRI
ncbi:phage portal protein [Rhodococcus hoagii]|nr:phage portal protein [Prescottella equi]